LYRRFEAISEEENQEERASFGILDFRFTDHSPIIVSIHQLGSARHTHELGVN
jgi:hypothetical protein